MDHDEIRMIMENRYTIDCVQMILEPQLPDTSHKTHKGSGLIVQSSDGSFSLKMYCNGDISPNDVFSRLNLKAGELITEKYYYRLSAKDIKGRQWVAKRIMPDIQARHDTDGYIINTDVRELSYSSDLYDEVTTDYADIYFPGDIHIPFNTFTKVEKIVDGKQRSVSTSLDIAKFNTSNFDFEMEKEADFLILKTLSKNSNTINDTVIIRFVEALQFVLARPLSWSIIELFHDKTQKVRVRTCKKNQSESRIGPPISFQINDRSNKVWELFGKYLEYVITYNDELWHPIFRRIHAVIESGYSPIDTEALVLSVSIEGLLKEEFNNLEFKKTELEKLIKDDQCRILQLELVKGFRDRLTGFFSNMFKPRAIDFLYILKDKNLIGSELLVEYDKLRNPSAHGEVANSSEFQVYLDRCSAVLVLFYHLIFLLIGYTGPYTDYSTPSKQNFPLKEFKNLLVTNKDGTRP